VCTNRVYVHRQVADAFTEAVVQRVARLKVGDGMDPATDVGPLIDRAGFDKVNAHVKDALQRGARCLLGSCAENCLPRASGDNWGMFYPPMVLGNVTSEMLLTREETFGPIVAISTFEDEAEVIELANGTPYGLAAYVFTNDAARAERVIPRLRFGHVGLNTGSGPAPETPFGGMKQSGYGREGGLEGLLEFRETQTVANAPG
jgi:succinate-semialdehyde dehydrogenase/glutarate-semialdehyde dehydrogenase